MSQQAMLDNIEKELLETEFSGEQKFTHFSFLYFVILLLQGNLLSACL